MTNRRMATTTFTLTVRHLHKTLLHEVGRPIPDELITLSDIAAVSKAERVIEKLTGFRIWILVKRTGGKEVKYIEPTNATRSHHDTTMSKLQRNVRGHKRRHGR